LAYGLILKSFLIDFLVEVLLLIDTAPSKSVQHINNINKYPYPCLY